MYCYVMWLHVYNMLVNVTAICTSMQISALSLVSEE